MSPQQILNQYGRDGLVIFAGAGCSVAPPSALPGWNDLNDALLEILWEQINQYGVDLRHRDKFLNDIKTKRTENLFPPDYQAQLMAERAGIKYFQLLSAVDADHYNPVHHFTALLAKAGLLRAVVTTNFDRNFERAFTRYGIAFRPCFEEEEFEALAWSGHPAAIIPVIKIHGCCSAPASMVDTRQQRLRGRSQALNSCLLQLLNNHYFIYGGFSGADLDHDENYLGLRKAARSAKGFTYLHLPASPVRSSMLSLIAAYDSKAQAVATDPAIYLQELLQQTANSPEPFVAPAIPTTPIREKLREKAAAIEPLDAMNMLVSLAESYGDEITARFLYDKIWKNRVDQDYAGSAFPEFLCHYSRSYVFNFEDRIERAANAGVTITLSMADVPEELKDVYINPAKKSMLHDSNTASETTALIALTQTFIGSPALFNDFPESMMKELQAASPAELADMYYYYSIYTKIYGPAHSGIAVLNTAVEDMEAAFDEPRLVQLLSSRCMLKARTDDLESAIEDGLRAMQLAEIYHDPHLDATATLALAVCFRKSNKTDEAYAYASNAYNTFYALKRLPQFVECCIEMLTIILQLLKEKPESGQLLLDTTAKLADVIKATIQQRVEVYEPEYCYLMGMIINGYSSEEDSVGWFANALIAAADFEQHRNYAYFKESYRQLNILDKVEEAIASTKH
jgi:tetratricopeptide (TPR) repeat protein